MISKWPEKQPETFHLKTFYFSPAFLLSLFFVVFHYIHSNLAIFLSLPLPANIRCRKFSFSVFFFSGIFVCLVYFKLSLLSISTPIKTDVANFFPRHLLLNSNDVFIPSPHPLRLFIANPALHSPFIKNWIRIIYNQRNRCHIKLLAIMLWKNCTIDSKFCVLICNPFFTVQWIQRLLKMDAAIAFYMILYHNTLPLY